MSYNASNTYKTFLMHSTDGSTYTKVIDIRNFPDLGQAPEMLDTTTLTDRMRTFVLGILEGDALSFDANFDPADYATCKTLAEGDEAAPTYYAVWFGGTEVANSDPTPTGDLGKFSFKGRMATPVVTGAGVNEVRSMQLTIAPATPITATFS